MNPPLPEEEWTAPTALLRGLLQGASRDGDSCQCRTLSVESGESTILELRAKPTCQVLRPFHAITKLYKDNGIARSRDDASVLLALGERGVKVPAVLGVVPGQNGILMEWFGTRTLADMLKDREGIAPGVWERVLAELAGLHGTLNQLWGDRSDIPAWAFSRDQRRSWALEGMDSWLSWLPAGAPRHALTRLQSSIDALVDRLFRPEAEEDVIWGDCNPKNILVHEGDIRFIDFQLKRASRMMDLVLLFTFADSAGTYLPSSQSHALLALYWQRFPGGRPLADFLRAYDDEVVWRILVYGGMLLRKREKRLASWREVALKMAQDLPELIQR